MCVVIGDGDTHGLLGRAIILGDRYDKLLCHTCHTCQWGRGVRNICVVIGLGHRGW